SGSRAGSAFAKNPIDFKSNREEGLGSDICIGRARIQLRRTISQQIDNKMQGLIDAANSKSADRKGQETDDPWRMYLPLDLRDLARISRYSIICLIRVRVGRHSSESAHL